VKAIEDRAWFKFLKGHANPVSVIGPHRTDGHRLSVPEVIVLAKPPDINRTQGACRAWFGTHRDTPRFAAHDPVVRLRAE
jgi:hypothetical protein